MTHVLISADMEGITGVTCPADVEPGTDGWRGFRQLMASDVNAAVEGFFAAGASAVTVNDAHATKRNIPIEALDERATLITGTHKRLGMMEGIADGVDAVAFVGYHTGAGRQGVLSHTYIGTTILDVRINGQQAGEGRMNALLAAEHGVPVVLVTGDDLTCADARADRRCRAAGAGAAPAAPPPGGPVHLRGGVRLGPGGGGHDGHPQRDADRRALGVLHA